MDLPDIRKRINMIDFEILKLLNSRMEFALRTKRFKSSVTDTARENEVIDYIERHSRGLIQPEFCKKLFANVISESKRLQKESRELIGFYGEHGGFGEVAARCYNEDLLAISCSDFREVLEAVENRLFEFGILPIESTLGGTVPDVNEFLADSALLIVGEVRVPIRYSLLTLPETDPREIRVAFSHPQMLSHCQRFLRDRKIEGRPYYDSGAAARMLMRERPEATAVVAPGFAGDFYNLVSLHDGIEDLPGNYTRFLVLSKNAGSPDGNRCSVVFSTENRAGALFEILQVFADAGVNLTKIESIPNRRDPGTYVFFVDFEGSLADPRTPEVLERVARMTRTYRFLGCYPAANNPNHGS